MIPDPKEVIVKYDPYQKNKYKVGYLAKKLIVTEIKRPDPQAVLVLRSGEVVELSNEEIRVLLHQDNGPLIPRDLLSLAAADAPAADDEKAEKAGDEEGKKPEGSQEQAPEAGSSEKPVKKSKKPAN